MYSIQTTIVKAVVNMAKTFLAVYGVGLAVGDDNSITVSIAASAITAVVTAIRNFLKNR